MMTTILGQLYSLSLALPPWEDKKNFANYNVKTVLSANEYKGQLWFEQAEI